MSNALLSRVDHLVYATPDLHSSIERIEQLLGVRAMMGGQHPGGGTRNALMALGPQSYLEIVGPDPEQQTFQSPRLFSIDTLTAPRLVTWAANTPDLDRAARTDLGKDLRLGAVSAGGRQTPQGASLSWRFTNPRTVLADGIVPFFIDWGKTPHPSWTAALGCVLTDLRAEHPEPERVRQMLGALGLDLQVSRGPEVALIASIESPRGFVELR